MPVPLLRLSLIFIALLLFVGALLFPAQDIENSRIANIDRLRQESAQWAAQLQPDDDTYVRPLDTPYPINAPKLFPWLLCFDGILALALAAIASRFRQITGPESWALTTHIRRDWPYLLLLTIVAAALRIAGSNRDFWADETTTLLQYVRHPVVDILVQTSSTNNHLLNSLLSHLSIAVFGEHEWTARLPAIIFGTATIPLLYLLVRRFSPRVEAILAALALALSYHHVFFSQDARGYSGMLFGGLLGTFALIEALAKGSRSAWAVYCAGMLICVGSVATGLFVLAGQLIVVTLLRPNRAFYATFALVVLLLLNFYFFVIPDILGGLLDQHMRPEAGWRLSSGLVQAFLDGLRLGLATIPLVGAGGVIIAIGIWSYFRQDRLFASLLLAPEALMVLLVASHGIGVVPRHFLYSLPVVIIFAARGIRCVVEVLPIPLQRWSYTAAFTAVLAVSTFLLRTWWTLPMQDFRSARQYIESRLQKGDAVATMGTAEAGYRYYWPQILVENRVSSLQELMNHSRRVWLLYTFAQDMDRRRPKLMQFVREKFEEQRVFPGMVLDGEVRVCLYDDSRSTD
jgi:4-amino-4-deoxy-L-arabinose transferase-like glycosyltransferase